MSNFIESAQPSFRDVFSMAVGRTLCSAAISIAFKLKCFLLIAGQCESDASAAISLN